MAAVYIQPRAVAIAVLSEVCSKVGKLQNRYHEAVPIIEGDFNHCNFKKVMPKVKLSLFVPKGAIGFAAILKTRSRHISQQLSTVHQDTQVN